ncbi:MAG: hypothetical protein H7A45_08400 [Verrucomicrobiales bacterium]|nr:hypothetical protein [Verrucomicrobiales bacterium]
MNDDGLTEPNAGAYVKEETRHGPPLEYVAEKLAGSLKALHTLHLAARRDLPDDLPPPRGLASSGIPYNPKTGSVLLPCEAAFRYGLTSFLALNNLLGVANDPELGERLLRLSPRDFDLWLQRVRVEGSVL